MNRNQLFLLILPLFFACNFVDNVESDRTLNGLKPIYGDAASIVNIALTDTVEMENPGKIVYLAPRLFVNEINKGIHVINNQDPVNPFKESFISIPFNKDLAVKNNIIYADNDKDLISIIYHSKDSIQLISRQKNVFDHLPVFPVDYNGYFECIDDSKGTVIGWYEAELLNPECRTF